MARQSLGPARPLRDHRGAGDAGRAGIRGWELWALQPASARAYVIAVMAAGAGAAAVACWRSPWHEADLLPAAVLLACALASAESTRRIGEPFGEIVRNMGSIWLLGAVSLAPAVPFLLATGIYSYTLVRVPRPAQYRRVFSGVVLALAYGSASQAFHAVPARIAGAVVGTGLHAVSWTLTAVACGLAGIAINEVLVLTIAKKVDPAIRIRRQAASRKAAAADGLELSLGVLTAALVTISPLLVAFALPAILLCKHSVMRGQLVARRDPVTGVLGAGPWRREAEAALIRARRGGTGLAVAVLTVDQLPGIIQVTSRAVGDQVLRKAAAILTADLPADYVAGRVVNGDAIAILMPRTAGAQAQRICEGLRDRVSAETVAVDSGDQAGFVFRLTVSAGVAVMTSDTAGALDLVAAAQAALARAGRENAVCLHD